MSDNFDFNRFSGFIGGIIDRKLKALSMSITNSTGYFKTNVANSAATALQSKNSATDSASSAARALNSATTIDAIWNNFTSTYAGLGLTDPTKSSLNQLFNVGAFRIRSVDQRLRIVTSIAGGVPVWEDAKVAADVDSVIAIANPRFLFLNKSTVQNVVGPVTFTGVTIVPRITDFNSNQAATAFDLTKVATDFSEDLSDLSVSLNNSITNLSTSIDGRLSTLTTTLNASITDLGTSVNARIDTLSTSVDIRFTSLTTNIDTRFTTLGTTITDGLASVNQAISDEVTRATSAESTLSTSIDSLSEDLDDEVTRATAAETGISQSLTNFMNLFSHGANAYGSWDRKPGRLYMNGQVNAGATSEITVSVILPVGANGSDYTILLTPMASKSEPKKLWCPRLLILSKTSELTRLPIMAPSDGVDDPAAIVIVSKISAMVYPL